ncbi:hypothetical protein [Enterovibrio norvegicus]|uniref:hypothetical protein n=1 Tax=Enterovibrio norvegicus TaxID=188144 RepID=UPI00037A5B49|nr:hypothetical protein [Enterovibrio norvegicus]OEF53817.1 hypothetical protein A1OU_01605 [Enterovibrio norvegicus]
MPLVVAIASLIFIKRLSHKECVFSGLLIIFLALLVIPLVNAMKGMDDFYQQKELLQAFDVLLKNQEILASKSEVDEQVIITEIERIFNDDQKEDYQDFRVFIDTYDVFVTFLGLSLGVNILCLGISDKLPKTQGCENNFNNTALLSKVEGLEKSAIWVKVMLASIIGLLLLITLKVY